MSNKSGGMHTKREIGQQPKVWLDTYDVVKNNRQNINEFLDEVFKEDTDVILTGAGSSAFIGGIASGALLCRRDIIARPIPTTDLVTHPEHYLSRKKRTLMVSFARSGNSPESIAGIDIANKYCNEIFHLIITCNSTGKLYTEFSGENVLRILLPKETNDVSLAMTSSFTSMLLAFILIARIDTIESELVSVEVLARSIERFIEKTKDDIEKLASLDFKRAVFLGSGPLGAAARESHLKLQELTDGKVICKFDSFLGFRHGPKVVIDDTTLVVYQLSNDAHAQLYELDLVKQINNSNQGLAQVLIAQTPILIDGFTPSLQLFFTDKSEKSTLDIEYLSIAHVVFAQILGYYKSIQMGLDPDAPSVSGAIARVVEGVTIYDFKLA
ncbi:MAG: sugar isomerase [Gelidibacter sp.]